MKGILTLLLSGGLILASSVGFSATTDITTGWICTTNASTSSVDTDIAADKQMSETAKSAADAFAFASANCRDCTKITCEVK